MLVANRAILSGFLLLAPCVYGPDAPFERQRGLVPNAVVTTNRPASVLGKPLATRQELSSKAPFGMISASPTSRPILTPALQFSFIVEDSGTTTIAFTKTGAHSEALICWFGDLFRKAGQASYK